MLERNLQNVANYLVASLAVADLFVACLVMPLGAVYEVRFSIVMAFGYSLFFLEHLKIVPVALMHVKAIISLNPTWFRTIYGNPRKDKKKWTEGFVSLLLLGVSDKTQCLCWHYRLVQVGYSDRSFVIYGRLLMFFAVLPRYYIWLP